MQAIVIIIQILKRGPETFLTEKKGRQYAESATIQTIDRRDEGDNQ